MLTTVRTLRVKYVSSAKTFHHDFIGGLHCRHIGGQDILIVCL